MGSWGLPTWATALPVPVRNELGAGAPGQGIVAIGGTSAKGAGCPAWALVPAGPQESCI